MRIRLAVALGLAAAVGACGSVHALRGPALRGLTGAPVIQVTNQHAQDMKLYLWAEPGLSWRRLGTVTAKSTATFEVPRLFWSQPLRLILQPFASPGDGFATESFVAEEGRVIDLRVDVVLSRSAVYAR